MIAHHMHHRHHMVTTAFVRLASGVKNQVPFTLSASHNQLALSQNDILAFIACLNHVEIAQHKSVQDDY